MTKNSRVQFVKLAQNRVNKALTTIELIGNLSDKTNYSYTEDDVVKICSALEAGLKDMKEKFKAVRKYQTIEFKLEDDE
mgnify:CR=1 FL=1|tara:strand:- start:149 stop:385 length:237 start_codon:yes stop_codon:yes gene_type:complete